MNKWLKPSRPENEPILCPVMDCAHGMGQAGAAPVISEAELAAFKKLEKGARMVIGSRTIMSELRGFRIIERALKELDKARGK